MSDRILVVDDDTTIADVLVTALQDEGYSVREAADGRSALATVKDWQPSVVLLDLMLPGLDGWAVIDELRREPLEKSLSLVIVSASREAPPRSAGRPPIAAIFKKPFDLSKVLATVAALMPA
jgi:DNA-binding response OmpR family regulator